MNERKGVPHTPEFLSLRFQEFRGEPCRGEMEDSEVRRLEEETFGTGEGLDTRKMSEA